MPDKITRNYEITGEPAQLNVLEFLFKQIWYLGMIGSSRKIELYVDGDGAVQLKFKRDGIDVRDLTDNKDLGYGVIKYDENDANYPWYFDLGDNMQDEDSEIQELKKLLEHDLIQKVIIGDKRLIVKLRPTSFVQNVINLFEHFKKVLKKKENVIIHMVMMYSLLI